MELKNMNEFKEFDHNKEKESGFFDLPTSARPCMDPGHNPPSHMVIPPGKGYRHVCPSCGKVSIIIPNHVHL